ncbi:MAG TPA: hypothetical protein PKC47_00300 [Petrimonas sp.]|nr:hypothetical protein [Petrimonas sp.]
MIALALLFIVIIGLLWVVVQVLQHFFETYSSLDENVYATDFENKLQQQKTITSCQENNKEINAILAKRLTEMEQKFPTSHDVEEHPQEEAVVLTETLKNVLTSYMNLLKVKPQDSNY